MARRYDRRGNMDFPAIVQKGENTRDPEYGFVSQTVNGSGRCVGSGWNRLDTGWYTPTQDEVGGPWQKTGNRTAE